MKLSEKILFIFLFFFFLMAFFSLKAYGVGLEYGVFFGSAMIIASNFILPSKGFVLSGIGIIIMSLESFLIFGIVIVGIGLSVAGLELWEMQEEIKKTFFERYNIMPEKIDIPLFKRLKLSFKKRKEIFNTYFVSNIFYVKIKTEQGWQEFYYDNVNKKLIEK